MSFGIYEKLIQSGPGGVAAASLPLVGLLCLGLLPFAWRRGTRVISVPVALNLGLAVGMIISGCVLVERARAVTAELSLHANHADLSLWPPDLAQAVSLWSLTLPSLALAGLITLPSSLVALGRRWLGAERQRGHSVLVPLVTMATSGVGLVLTAAAIILHRESHPRLPGCEHLSVEDCRRALYESLLAMFDEVGAARWWVLALGVAASGAVLLVVILRRKAPRPVSRSARCAAVASLAIGATAFAMTRGMAADGRRPLPLWSADIQWPMVESLPPASNDCVESADVGPVVHIDRKTTLDGAPFDGPAGLARDLASKLELWKRLWPDREPPGIVVFAVAPKTPMAGVGPVVSAALAAGYRTVAVAESLPRRTFETRTLGTVAYSPRVCALRYPIDGFWPMEGTWGDFARALSPGSCPKGSH